MTQKTTNIIGWILTAIVALIFIASASMKLTGGEELSKSAESMGLSLSTIKLVGILEIFSVMLFIFPRTGILGTLLLAAYMGGAIVTHLEHAQPIFAPILIECIVWITAVIRFPELLQRIKGKYLAA